MSSAHGVPEWAYFLSTEEYAAFAAALDEYFSSKQISYKLAEGMVELDESFLGSNRLGLQNLAQHCKKHEVSEYLSVISRYFDFVRESFAFDREFKKTVHDFSKVQEYISVRVYDDAYISNIGKENAVGRDVAEGLYAQVVFDLPQAIQSVGKEHQQSWRKTDAELLELGIANAKNKYPQNIGRADADGFLFWYANNRHFFTANLIFEFEEHPELIGAHGSLVSFPTRHAALTYPIETAEINQILGTFIGASLGIYSDGPGSLSHNIYWYKDGVFMHLPYEIENGELQFTPPVEFIELLDALAEN